MLIPLAILVAAGSPVERLAWVRGSTDPAALCVVACSHDAWHALGLRVRRPPQPCQRCPVGQLLTAPVEADPDQWIGDGPPRFEVVRLRERRRLTLEPFAATFDDAGAELLGRVVSETDLSGGGQGPEQIAGKRPAALAKSPLTAREGSIAHSPDPGRNAEPGTAACFPIPPLIWAQFAPTLPTECHR